jgi:hypothetical protein
MTHQTIHPKIKPAYNGPPVMSSTARRACCRLYKVLPVQKKDAVYYPINPASDLTTYKTSPL